ncbi:pectinesterase family protein [Streptomyces sp. SP18BB07]|uniref:pectinesterase family protein n=1 Tax=Streptomyces sp. SP18BB07 TaxID=3002522 RepID=UPI002E781444|nr:pectinesterase family protein [Streptomyces sp. SP18BB07]MEE1761196.1 pectinesterase family protein [Streptomyces sp. SP18BB07]
MTNTERGLSRRSFLFAATAVAAASALAGGVVMAGAPTAGAATGSNAEWRINHEPGTQPDNDGNLPAMRGYGDLLKAIKTACSDHRINPYAGTDRRGHPVHVTANVSANQYTIVDLVDESQTLAIRVYMRRQDAYVMGWQQGVATPGTGGSQITWGTYFTLEATAQAEQPSALPGITASNTRTEYNGLGTYTNLSRQGADRLGTAINTASLNQAVRTLGTTWPPSDPVGYTSEVAKAILQIIVALAEAARFRNQAEGIAVAFRDGGAFTINQYHMDQHNNWGSWSAMLLDAFRRGVDALSGSVTIEGIEILAATALARYLMMAHHSDLGTSTHSRHDELKLELAQRRLVSPYGTGDYWTVQEAISAAPTSGACEIVIEKGVYHEVLSVPKDKSWLTIEGVTGNRADVVIYNTRCHGMINPATGLKYGTQGSAVATFRPPNLTVQDLTITNTFDRNAHPEISPYETQAVAIAAMGDRQVYRNVAIWSHQDTLLCKGETPTTQARQHFVNCHIRGDVDFIFGNATAVIDRSMIQVLPWPGGTVMAPNTDKSKKYGILISSCTITTSGVPSDTMHLGRPWNNTADAWPQAVVRECDIQAGIKDAQPWTNMVPEYPWQGARFKEYGNFGPGAGTGANAPKLTATEAADYTAQKYLAGTDGWNPLG